MRKPRNPPDKGAHLPFAVVPRNGVSLSAAVRITEAIASPAPDQAAGPGHPVAAAAYPRIRSWHRSTGVERLPLMMWRP